MMPFYNNPRRLQQKNPAIPSEAFLTKKQQINQRLITDESIVVILSAFGLLALTSQRPPASRFDFS